MGAAGGYRLVAGSSMLPLVIDDRGGRHRGRPTPGHLSDAGLPPDSPRLPVVTPADCLTPASWKPTSTRRSRSGRSGARSSTRVSVRGSRAPMAGAVASWPHGELEGAPQPERDQHSNRSVHRAEQATPERARRVTKGDDDCPTKSDDRDSPPPDPYAEKQTSEHRRRTHGRSVSSSGGLDSNPDQLRSSARPFRALGSPGWPPAACCLRHAMPASASSTTLWALLTVLSDTS